MGAGCSKDKDGAKAAAAPAPQSRTLTKNASGGRSLRDRQQDLAAQFVAEFPADDDEPAAAEPPAYAEGSREATLLKVYYLLDKDSRGYVTVPEWKDYVVQAGLTLDAFAKEVATIVAAQGARDPRVAPAQFVAAMMRLTADLDDPAFGHFVAQTLITYRGKSQKQMKAPVEETSVYETPIQEGPIDLD